MNLIKLPSDFSSFSAKAACILPRRINSCITPTVVCGDFTLICIFFVYFILDSFYYFAAVYYINFDPWMNQCRLYSASAQP